MKKELKVGMLCRLTKCAFAENNGKFVQLLGYGPVAGNGNLWEFSCQEGVIGYFLGDAFPTLANISWCCPDQLIPISDPDIDVSDIDIVDMTKELANA